MSFDRNHYVYIYFKALRQCEIPAEPQRVRDIVVQFLDNFFFGGALTAVNLMQPLTSMHRSPPQIENMREIQLIL